MIALIIVDIQNDFLPGGSLYVPRGEEIIPLVNALVPNYSMVVATQDWHPAKHESFASQHPGMEPFQQITLHGLPQTLWPEHCVQHSYGAEFAADLTQEALVQVFQKGLDTRVDSYSGFFDNGHIHATGLGDYLMDKGVSEVHICGLAADYCVYFTALDALKLGFKTVILQAATRPIEEASYATKKAYFKAQGGRLL